MKKLILSLILLPILAHAKEIKEISDKEIKSEFLSVVKDVEVENMLGSTSEFNDCRKKNEFDSSDNPAAKEAKIKAASDCFKQKITGKNSKALEKLADDLKLENYGVIKSKNVSDITEYLSTKMRKSLTGVDPKDKSAASKKWENQKIVDQKVFVDMYTTQLMKSALFEVSRYCFENLRGDSPKDNFSEHWSNTLEYGVDSNGVKVVDMSAMVMTNINDQGHPSFLGDKLKDTDLSNQKEVLGKLVSGLTPQGTPLSAEDYRAFFGFCQAALPKLCDQFKKESKVQNASIKSVSGLDPDLNGKMTKGANSCLTLDRLQSMRTALAKTALVAKQFEEMGNEKDQFAIKMLKDPKFYERGKGKDEDSIDELTNFSSSDMIASTKKNEMDELTDLEEECKNKPSSKDCNGYLSENDSLDKAIHNVESEMNLKREIEVAKVKEIYTKPDELEKYLTDNGHFDLLNKLNDKLLKPEDIESELATIYNARKVAEIEALKFKVGKRQISEKDGITDPQKADMIKDNIKETKEERARLAQVVMFNNIITSQLELTDQATKKGVGRNTNAWKKEMQGLEETKSYDEDLFAGIQSEADANGSTLEDTSVVGGGIIDSILGKKEEKKN
jgi:hypothetical protein